MIKTLKRNLYNSFYQDYISEESIAHNFIDSPHEISWDKQLRSIDLNAARYQKVKQFLINQNKDLTSEKAIKYLDYLNDPKSIILITGQQLGLFASPIYTIYKIISTIKLAEELNIQKPEYKFIPVFWLESEDHDFRETNHLGILDKNLLPRQIVYGGNDRGKVSLRHYKLESAITSFISEIEENLLETEFSADLFDKIREYYKPERDWTAAIKLFLADIFKSSGLLFFHPGNKEIKEISVDFFSQLLLEGKTLKESFDNQSNTLISRGYHNQVKNIPGQTFVHFEQKDYQREHLYKEKDTYYFKGLDKKYRLEEIITSIKNNPQSVSSTVVSRPLLQSWLLPVGAYIAGPGEIAYWAQLGDMFKEFNLAMPVVYPRISTTIIEPKIVRYLDKYSPDIEEIALKQDMFIEDYFKNHSDLKGDNPLRSLNQLLDTEANKVESYLKSLDPTLVGAGTKSLERMKQTLNNLENRVVKVQEQKESQLTNHLKQVHTSFFPNGIPQERFQSLVYYLNKFGPQFMNRLLSDLEIENFNHQLLYL